MVFRLSNFIFFQPIQYLVLAVATDETSETLKQVTLDVKGSADGKCETQNEICTGGPKTGQATYLVSELKLYILYILQIQYQTNKVIS